MALDPTDPPPDPGSTPAAATEATAPPELDLDGFLTDADGELHRCAAHHWYTRAVDAHGAPLPIVLDHAHVRATLKDRRLSPRSFTDDMIEAGISRTTAEQLTPLFRRHGDEHRFFRSLLAAAFTPRSVERLRPVAAEIAGRLADGLGAHDGPTEFVGAFAEPLPPEVFAVLFGLPRTDRDRLAHWAAVVALAFTGALAPEQIVAVEDAAAEQRAWATELIEARRAEPTDDLVTHLLRVEVDGARLDDEDVVAIVTGFVFAGSETTKRQLTAMVQTFAAHPDVWRRLQADPELVPGAVEEVLRFAPIVPALTRVAVDPFELDGLRVDVGGRLVTWFSTANRDPGVFADPDRFDVTRPGADGHVTFGWGPHFCVGAGLARMELHEALRALLARFDPPEIDDEVAPSSGLVAPDTLPVCFRSRS